MVVSQKIRSIAAFLGIFLVSAGVFTYLEWQPSFKDPDSFYHAKMALLMLDHGTVKDFPWLPFTFLAERFTDHHFLYHVALLPFVSLFGPFLGLKVATVVFAAAAVTAFYGLLRSYQAKWPWLYALILTTSSGFTFRAGLAKAQPLVLALVFVALIVLRKKKFLPIFIVSFLYVWLYGGWPLMLILLGAVLVGDLVTKKFLVSQDAVNTGYLPAGKFQYDNKMTSEFQNDNMMMGRMVSVVSGLAVISGLVAGFVINPYFPGNVRFYWEQIVQITLVGYQSKLAVGGEWYPASFTQILSNSSTGLFILLLALLFLLIAAFWGEVVKKDHPPLNQRVLSGIATSVVLAGLFFNLTIRNSRHIEYFVPFLLFFVALLVSALVEIIDPVALRRRFELQLGPLKLLARYALPTFVFLLAFLAVRDVRAVRALYDNGLAAQRFRSSMAWLSENSEKDAIVFHDSWGDFPMLFYWNDANRYISGLDPTFLYRFDREKYELWKDIATGELTGSIGRAVADGFGAEFVFIKKQAKEFGDRASLDSSLFLAYEDEEAWVFQVLLR